MPNEDRIVDCHAHIIDPARFPFTGKKGYHPRPDEHGTREEFCAVLDRHGVNNGVLVQLSGYGSDNSANLDAMKAYPGRFKAIAVIDQDASDRALERLAAAGVVGVRDIAVGTRHAGFQAVLALGREGNATVKLSSLFRVSHMLKGFDDLDPFLDELLKAFGVDHCIWGSDWPFINVPRRPSYADLMTPLSRWFPDPADRARVLARNPRRLFGFGD